MQLIMSMILGRDSEERLVAEVAMNPGEIKTARELGYKGHNSYVWHSCALCGRERWTELRKGRPRHTICSSCTKITRRKKERLVTQGHMCPPHYWLVDSENVGRCKYCGQVEDFSELNGKLTLQHCH